jgi:hypothetical protein
MPDAGCREEAPASGIQPFLQTRLYPISAQFVGGDWIKWALRSHSRNLGQRPETTRIGERGSSNWQFAPAFVTITSPVTAQTASLSYIFGGVAYVVMTTP